MHCAAIHVMPCNGRIGMAFVFAEAARHRDRETARQSWFSLCFLCPVGITCQCRSVRCRYTVSVGTLSVMSRAGTAVHAMCDKGDETSMCDSPYNRHLTVRAVAAFQRRTNAHWTRLPRLCRAPVLESGAAVRRRSTVRAGRAFAANPRCRDD